MADDGDSRSGGDIAADARGQSPARWQVLVVDDEGAVRAIVADVLTDAGFAVLGAPSGEAALEVLVETGYRPELILLDMRMPGMGGAAFAAAYRRLPSPIAPLVVFTAANKAEADRLAAELGATAGLTKPFDLEELVELVTRLLPGAAVPPAGA